MSSNKEERLHSLDALRGLDMLLIIGLGSILWQVGAMGRESSWGAILMEQMTHEPWQGLHAYDLIFPLFVYLAGVSMNFSFRKRLRMGAGVGRILLHSWRRALVLVVLGWVVNGALSWDIETMRYASVLGLIGLSGALTCSLVLLLRGTIKPAIAAVVLLTGIGVAQYLCGELTPAGSFNAKVDALLCPGRLHGRVFDPEGPLCILSATVVCMLGYLSGRVFSPTLNIGKRLLILLGGGAVLIGASCFGPVIKNIWTPCFVLASVGIGAVLLGVFHLLCDVLPGKWWSYPLRVVGANALFIYLLTNVIDLSRLTDRLFAGTLRYILPPEYMGLGLSTAYFMLAWLLCFYLYRRGIYIKV